MSQVAKFTQNPPRQPAPEPVRQQVVDDPDDRIDPNVLETLPRTQFMEIIARKVTKALQKDVVDPLNQELTKLKSGLSSTQVEKMIEAASGKHKDFYEFQEEMLELAKVHKTLTPEQLYKMAKAESPPEKIAKIEEKYKSADDGAKKNVAFSFGGLMPSNGGEGGPNRRMAPNDAADDAWDKVVAEMGGQPAFTE
jgi:hypothetical protein